VEFLGLKEEALYTLDDLGLAYHKNIKNISTRMMENLF
jgi:hypothetical protein